MFLMFLINISLLIINYNTIIILKLAKQKGTYSIGKQLFLFILSTVVIFGLFGSLFWDCSVESSASACVFVGTAKDVDGIVPTPTAVGGNGSNKYVSPSNSSEIEDLQFCTGGFI